MFGDSKRALKIAEEAASKVERIDAVTKVVTSQLEAHIKECGDNWKELREDNRDWRRGLGNRLDQQDETQNANAAKLTKILVSGLTGLVMILLSIVGFLISNLPAFHTVPPT